MARVVILTAGKATRVGELAPHGCKALVDLNGRPTIGWQIDALFKADLLKEEPLIVCRSEHVDLLKDLGRPIVNDRGFGAADALASALPYCDGRTLVAYADTFFTEVPRESGDWVGTSRALGGRSWDVIRDGYVTYERVPAAWTAMVCVGLYSFTDPERLVEIIERLTTKHILSQPEMGLAPVLNVYRPWRQVDIASWKDVGTAEAIAAWSEA